MARTRKWRIVIAAVLAVALLAAAWQWGRPMSGSTFYAYLEQHPAICRVVRCAFVVAGKEDEFDLGIIFAEVDRFTWPTRR